MDNLIWVKVETTKATDDIWSFKGQLPSTVFDAILSNQLTRGFIKLDKVYWINTKYDDYGNEDGLELCEYGEKGRLEAYRGDLFLKVEHLVSIAPLDREIDVARFKGKEEKHLSVVCPIRP